MNIDSFSPEAQDGLRRFALEALGDELAFDGTATEHWCWMWFVLREAADRPEWFPKGKWATLQRIEDALTREARESLKGTDNAA